MENLNMSNHSWLNDLVEAINGKYGIFLIRICIIANEMLELIGRLTT
jgi:hypothetical protein